jgi:nitrogen fixation/metabolism regulation signal transduction histidine kinase
MTRFRHKVLVLFLAATAVPLAATGWLALSLLSHSLDLARAEQLGSLASTLEDTARRLYHREREALAADVASGRAARSAAAGVPGLSEFEASGEPERYVLDPEDGGRLFLLRRSGGATVVYERDLGGLKMTRLTGEVRAARRVAGDRAGRDLARGFTWTFLLVGGLLWALSGAALVWMTGRSFRRLERLTEALGRLAKGDYSARVGGRAGDDEVGRAVAAFDHTAEELASSRERLIQLTQAASWRGLARKMAHELKNSLTPIRLTVEEMLARAGVADREFAEEATRIVVGEVEGLERRLRAFSEFAAEPEPRMESVDVRAVAEERIRLLEPQFPDLRFVAEGPNERVTADRDLLGGALTNLLKNAAEATPAGGTVWCRVSAGGGRVTVEVEDGGSGVAPEQRATLFEPVISRKKGGMGLGLSIARRNALLSGGELQLAAGRGPGACFRLALAGKAAA